MVATRRLLLLKHQPLIAGPRDVPLEMGGAGGGSRRRERGERERERRRRREEKKRTGAREKKKKGKEKCTHIHVYTDRPRFMSGIILVLVMLGEAVG